MHTNNALDPAISPELFRPAADGSRPVPGNPPLSVTMEIMPLPEGFSDELIEAAARGVERWAEVQGVSINISVARPGPEDVYDGEWASRFATPDGRNTIEFLADDWPFFIPINVLAFSSAHTDDEGRILEADIYCNARDYRWMVFNEQGSFPALAKMNIVDAEAVITHEMGHVFGIDHSQYNWASMYFLLGVADTRARNITSDDREGLRRLYPATAADVPPPSLWGISETASGGDCNLGAATYDWAIDYYVNRISPLPGPHEMIMVPPLPGETVWPYCLLGAGFSADYFQGMDLETNGVPLGAAVSAQYIGPNFVQAVLMNGAGGYPPLAAGSYDASVTQSPGGKGVLPQGLFVNADGNNLPEAVIQPATSQTRPGVWVRLDGSGSFDLDGDTIAFNWSVAESPEGYPGLLSADTAQVVSLYAPGPGIYVARLVVNDKTVDGIADQAAIRAAYSSGGSGGSDFSMFGCALAPGRVSGHGRPAFPVFVLAPLALALILRKRMGANP
jgi:hypothetical protein